jgi:hypothetical protein
VPLVQLVLLVLSDQQVRQVLPDHKEKNEIKAILVLKVSSDLKVSKVK